MRGSSGFEIPLSGEWPDSTAAPTRAVSADDTQSTPESPVHQPFPDRPLKIIIAVLAAALLLAVIAIVVLAVWD